MPNPKVRPTQAAHLPKRDWSQTESTLKTQHMNGPIFHFSRALLVTVLALPAQAQTVTHRVPMFKNDEVKVWKTIIVPNSPLSMHRHEHGRTIVVLKGGTLTIQQDTGEKKTVDWKTGLDADPPGNKKHADVNETKETIEVIVVEDKGVGFSRDLAESRGGDSARKEEGTRSDDDSRYCNHLKFSYV